MKHGVTAGQCFDVKADSGERDTHPWKSLMDLQTWTCSAIDPHQVSWQPARMADMKEFFVP